MLAKNTHLMILGLMLIFLTTACSRVQVPVPVTRPAEINLAQYKKIAVGPFQGIQDRPSNVFDLLVTAVQALGDAASGQNDTFQTNWQGQRDDGSDVALHIFNSLTKTGRFSLIDFSGIPNARASGDAVLMVSGTVAQKNARNHVSSAKRKNSDGKVYYVYTRETNATYNVNVKLVDITTGAIYLSRQYPCTKSHKRTQNNSKPPKLYDGEIHNLYDKCKKQIAGKFAKAVAPYTETVYASFAKIDESLETETGISHAKVGNWLGAIASFETVTQNVGMLEAEVQSKAWWNLGLAYEFDFQFAKAAETVQKAYGIYPDSEYMRELGNISKLQQDQERLKQQQYKEEAPAAGGS